MMLGIMHFFSSKYAYRDHVPHLGDILLQLDQIDGSLGLVVVPVQSAN